MRSRNVWRLCAARTKFAATPASLARASRWKSPRDGRAYAVKIAMDVSCGGAPLARGLVRAKCWEQATRLATEWLSRHVPPDGAIYRIAVIRARRGERRRSQWLD